MFCDDDSYDSFEDCFGFKQADMFRGHPKCVRCRRHTFPGALNHDKMCEMCEEVMEEIMMAQMTSEDESGDSDEEVDEIPLSKLSKQKKNPGTRQHSPSAKTTVAAKTSTHAKKVTPNAKSPAVKPKTNQNIMVKNPYAKKKSIPTKAKSGAATKTSRVLLGKKFTRPVKLHSKKKPSHTSLLLSKKKLSPIEMIGLRGGLHLQAKKQGNKYIVDKKK